jgi:4-amino-4-deoxy-L-arabinose transferase-like glycosyltransferase
MTWRKGKATCILCMLLVVGFYLRSESLWQTVVVLPAIRADAGDYFMYAYNLYHHGIYSRDHRGLSEATKISSILPDAVRSPGYPLFLTLFMGDQPISGILAHVLLIQVLISTLTVALAYLMYRRFLNLPWAASAALLTALSPHLIVVNNYLLSETLFCFFLVSAAGWVSLTSSRASWKTAGVLGGLLAAASLIRPSLQYFLLLLALSLYTEVPNRENAKRAAALLLGFLLLIAPWFVRNLTTLHQLSDDTLKVAFLHHGIYPDFMYDHQRQTYGYPYQFDPRSSEIGRNTGTVVAEIVERFRRAPLEYTIWFFLKKPVAFWSWNIVAGQGDVFIYPVEHSPFYDRPLFVWSHRLMQFLHFPLVCLGLLGCVLVWLPAATRKMGSEALPVVRFISLLLIYFTALHVVGASFPRYSIPLRPFIYGMAMFSAAFFWHHARPLPKHFLSAWTIAKGGG